MGGDSPLFEAEGDVRFSSLDAGPPGPVGAALCAALGRLPFLRRRGALAGLGFETRTLMHADTRNTGALVVLLALAGAAGCSRTPERDPSRQSSPASVSLGPTSVESVSKVADGGQGSDAGDAAAARDGGTTCPGVLAETTFRNALCSCGSIQASAHLATDGFDGTKGPPDGGLGGSIGSNKAQAWSAHVTVGGDLLTPGDLQTSASSEVRGNLDLGGTLAARAPVRVAANAAVVKALPRNVTVRGSASRVSSVAAPCDCTNIVPIAAMVAAYRPPANDDGSIGLSAGAAKGSNLGKIDLPSGHFYLSGIQSSGPLTIAAHGQTALYIDGNVQASGPLSFQLDPTAALDLFVAGTVSASAKLTLGVDGESGALPRVHLGLHGRSIGRRDHRVQRLRPGHFLRHVGLGRRLRLALRGRLQRERERDGPLRREHPERRQRVLRGVVLRRRQSVHGRLVQRRRQLQPRPCGERN